MPAGMPGQGGRGPIIVTASAVTSYTTTFPLTEAPMNESGYWLDAGPAGVGIDWTSINTTAAHLAISTQSGGSGVTDDSHSIINPAKIVFAADQSVSVTLSLDGTLVSGTHEVWCGLRRALSAHNSTGYEGNIAWDGGYAQIVAWNGARDNFTLLRDNQPSGVGPMQTGDVLKMTAIGNVLTLTHTRGVTTTTVATYTDTRFAGGAQFTTGQPAFGIWKGDTAAHYCVSSFTAVGL